MPQFVEATDLDNETVRRQIGREPRRMIGVSKRCRYGCPQVVVTKPIHSSQTSQVPALFPTMFWLSCPHLCRLVSALESEQWIERFRSRVYSDVEFARRLEMRHRQYASERTALVSRGDLRRLREVSPHLYRRLIEPGIGGIEHTGGVKCLHLHLADYLSGGANPIGEEVSRLLRENGSSMECDEGTCLHRTEPVAILNVGSNSVKLLVARVVELPGAEPQLEILSKQVSVTRLAERMLGEAELRPARRRLGSHAIERTAEATACLVAEAFSSDVSVLKVFGTAAVREAANREDLIQAIRTRTGLELSIISAEDEAELSFERACAALRVLPQEESMRDRVVVFDIGGASTEIAVGRCGVMSNSASVPIGALTAVDRIAGSFDSDGRLSETYQSVLLRHCSQTLLPALQGGLYNAREAAAVGGSVTTAAALLLGLKSYDPTAIHGYRLGYNEVHELLARLCRHTRDERRSLRGMISSDRADSVIGGMAILVSLMDCARVDGVYVSEQGLIEGLAWRTLEDSLLHRQQGP